MSVEQQPRSCPPGPIGRSACADLIHRRMAEIAAESGRNCEIVVSTVPPLIASPYGANGYVCPHGVAYWLEPTTEQIAEWNREGIE